MRTLEQTTVPIFAPEVSPAWLQDNAWWLVLAGIIALTIIAWGRKAR